MKKVYMTLGVALIVSGAFAQRPTGTKKIAMYPKGVTSIVNDAPAGAAKAGGDCIFSEDFEGGAVPAGWAIGDDVEQMTDDESGGDPLGTFVPAWVVGDAELADNGGYFPVPDEPTGNLFAMANDDGDPCNCDMDNVGLTTPAIDLTGMTNMGVFFRAFFDGFGDGAATILASGDGGTTWDELQSFPENTDNWQSLTASLDAYSNMADVRIRFQFDDGGGWVSGLAIDDVCVKALPANDLTLGGAFISDIGADFDDLEAANLEYTFQSIEQVTPMTFAGTVVNNGGATQTNVILTAVIDGNTYTSAPYPSLAAGANDTLYIRNSFLPSAVGNYSVQMSVAADDPTDVNPADNTKSRTFEVTDGTCNYMGVDGDNMTNISRISADTVFTPYNAIGNKFQIQNENSVAWGVGVAFYNLTKVGALVDVFLLSDSTTLSTAAVSDNVEITADMLNAAGGNTITFIPFDPVLSDPEVIPAPLDIAKNYVAFVENTGTDSVYIGMSGIVQPGGLWTFDQTGATPSFIQYIGVGNRAAMVRLFLADGTSCSVGISEVARNNANAVLGPNMPNPFTGYTTINYTLKQANTVTLEIFDMTGKLVMSKPQGKKAAGSYMVDLDGSPLSQGVYTYTLTVGQERMSRRMVVTK